jgi:hypothetical protein
MGSDFETLRERWAHADFLRQRLTTSPLLADGSNLESLLQFVAYGSQHKNHGYVIGAFFSKNPGLAAVYHEAEREWAQRQLAGGTDV